MRNPPAGNLDLNAAWASQAHEVLSALGTDPATGLTETEARLRQQRYGPNQLQPAAQRPVFSILADQFKGAVIVLLLVASTLAFVFSEFVEGLAIMAVVVVNGLIGFVTEWRAIRSMESLTLLDQAQTVVTRDGVSRRINAQELVPGDIVNFEAGDIVSADVRLTAVIQLQLDESALTGESLPVDKQLKAIPPETAVSDRNNMAFKGTVVSRGKGSGVVVATGQSTELGTISRLVATAEPQQTPLEKRLDVLGGKLVWLVLALAAVIAVAGIFTGQETFLAIEVAIALAVAAIPEGLPIVATIALARGMFRMARKNAVIGRLSAVETLGATSLILTDKTGTLTENRMSVTAFWTAGHSFSFSTDGRAKSGTAETTPEMIQLIDSVLDIACLSSSATVGKTRLGKTFFTGDPTEVALLTAALNRGIDPVQLSADLPEIDHIPFDPESKRMAILRQGDDGVIVAVKGAPEAVIPGCVLLRGESGDTSLSDAKRQALLEQAKVIGEQGLRTLAIATKQRKPGMEDCFGELIFLAIIGLEDPPRPGVREAVERCRQAGVRVSMVTGDHAATATRIAIEVSVLEPDFKPGQCVDGTNIDRILSASAAPDLSAIRVFSRVTPEQKLRLMAHYQASGQVVAMTGDGVNDAPALKQADIGIAMGVRGTDVAREAAAMVLRDDEFGTIVEAIAQGRGIYQNIRKFVVYLLSCNFSEVLVVTLATLAGGPLPLLPLQILFLNLVTDIFPALALGVGEGSERLMKMAPRPADEPILTRAHWLNVGLYGLVISVAVLGAMMFAITVLEFERSRAVSVSFCTLALAQLWHVFNMRDETRRLFNNEITRNAWIWVAVILCLALIMAAVYLPPLSTILRLGNPGLSGWLLILPASFLPLFLAPVVKWLAARMAQNTQNTQNTGTAT